MTSDSLLESAILLLFGVAPFLMSRVWSWMCSLNFFWER
jgi:hypothetical protein